MQGGTDEGFCLIYWQLSYRRKFIRNLWLFTIGAAAAPLMLLHFSPKIAFLLFEFFVAVSAISLMYTYRKWQTEVRIKTFNPT